MKKQRKDEPQYSFEQGPIRPPAESNSLLLRLTRNCHWNHCTFCPLYKEKKFSIRKLEHVLKDIDIAYDIVSKIRKETGEKGMLTQDIVNIVASSVHPDNYPLLNAVLHWYSAGMKSIFFQDADSLVIKPENLIKILEHIKKCFPDVERITSFGRTKTILNISDKNLKKYSELGLNRIHAGLETGSDVMLKSIKKGCTKEMHIKAGHKVKNACIELSECVLLGLGGKELSHEHAIETADVINKINPPIIRFLTLVAPRNVELFKGNHKEIYIPSTELDIAHEIKLFIKSLNGVTSYIESNNILNLLHEVEGTMPDAKEKIFKALDMFINLPNETRILFQVGKRLQLFSSMSDLNDTKKLDMSKNACNKFGINQNNADIIIREMMQNYM